MYIKQEPPEKNNNQPTPEKKKSKANLVVFVGNLFLLALAFFVIKNQDESKKSQNLKENTDKSGVSAEEANISGSLSNVNTENNAAANNISPVVLPKNVGVSLTAPADNNSASNVVNPVNKKSNKTRTS